MGAAVCVVGISTPKAHLDQSGADMDRSTMHMMDIERPYVTSAKTNVLETLKRLGWVPPSENPKYRVKWKMYRSAVIKNEEKLL